MTWREFDALLVGLLAADTRLWRRFAPKPKGGS